MWVGVCIAYTDVWSHCAGVCEYTQGCTSAERCRIQHDEVEGGVGEWKGLSANCDRRSCSSEVQVRTVVECVCMWASGSRGWSGGRKENARSGNSTNST